ncbi:penicillin-binding protein 1A [Sporocytophaga myxococcoides]|uniref:penicillin-binding protein 1A n=1 Tax=Sporocytophaga myxococcoides TaxID=153721 RepID=UPI00040806C7|nr:transglycosylase domain-containing protein [Sporocytophaga myxococcoides]
MSNQEQGFSLKDFNWKKWIKPGMIFLAVLFASIFIYITYQVYKNLPDGNDLKNIRNATASEIYSSDGILIGKYFIQDRTDINFEKLPKHLINALLATEDIRFYKHNGFDRRGMLRVLFKSVIMQDESSGGGSTVEQQLAKNLFPRKRYRFFSMLINKTREAIVATRLNETFNKNEILTLYFNTVPYGENAYGIAAGARRYFNSAVDSLNVQQAATLVGMLKATTSYNPAKNPEKAKERRNVVLQQMAKYQFLTQEEAEKYQKKDLKIRYNYLSHNTGLATYFREYLRQELDEWCNTHYKPDGTPYNLYTDGLKIYTTIDSKMQRHAEKAMTEHMSKLQVSFYSHWKNTTPWKKTPQVLTDACKRSDRYQYLKSLDLDDTDLKKELNKKSEMKVFTWAGEKDKNFSTLDSIKHYLYFLQAGFFAMDPFTGQVKVWVGGINHKYFKYDHVTSKRQVGSTFKPIVYAAALESGISPCEYFPNQRQVIEEYDNWSPKNADGNYGGYYSMTGALTNSVNTVSASLIMKAGVNKVVNFAEKLGISSPLDPVPSLALGTADVSLMEMVSAYGAFANGGKSVTPNYLLKIKDKAGKTIYKSNPPYFRQTVSAPTAEMITYMLRKVVQEGTAAGMANYVGPDAQIAGKTGTTQSHADGWFIGYTPSLVAGCWVGAEDRRVHFRSIDLGQGAHMAMPIFGKFMGKLGKDKKLKKYVYQQWPDLSEEMYENMDCVPFSENAPDGYPVDNSNTNEASEEELTSPSENQRSHRRQESKEPLNWFKNIFKKKKRERTSSENEDDEWY